MTHFARQLRPAGALILMLGAAPLTAQTLPPMPGTPPAPALAQETLTEAAYAERLAALQTRRAALDARNAALEEANRPLTEAERAALTRAQARIAQIDAALIDQRLQYIVQTLGYFERAVPSQQGLAVTLPAEPMVMEVRVAQLSRESFLQAMPGATTTDTAKATLTAGSLALKIGHVAGGDLALVYTENHGFGFLADSALNPIAPVRELAQ